MSGAESQSEQIPSQELTLKGNGKSELDRLRSRIDHLDWMLRRLLRERQSLAEKAVQCRGGGTDEDREKQILARCESDTERQIFRALFAHSKGQADVQRPVDGRD